MPTRCTLFLKILKILFILFRSTCFGHHCTHHQELLSCTCSLWSRVVLGLLCPPVLLCCNSLYIILWMFMIFSTNWYRILSVSVSQDLVVYRWFQHIRWMSVSHIHQPSIVPFWWKFSTQFIDTKVAKYIIHTIRAVNTIIHLRIVANHCVSETQYISNSVLQLSPPQVGQGIGGLVPFLSDWLWGQPSSLFGGYRDGGALPRGEAAGAWNCPHIHHVLLWCAWG